MEPSRLSAEPCPRCGCWMVRPFECGCHMFHPDYCANCRRWTFPELPRDQYTILTVEAPGPCDAGAVAHEHVKMLSDLWGNWERRPGPPDS